MECVVHAVPNKIVNADGFIQGLDLCIKDFSIPTEKFYGKLLLESRPLKKWTLLGLYVLGKMLCILYLEILGRSKQYLIRICKLILLMLHLVE